jgi:hypothetical protein
VTIRSRIGDYLFRALFPTQARVLDNVEVELIEAATASLRAKAAADAAHLASAGTRQVLEDIRGLVMRAAGPGV